MQSTCVVVARAGSCQAGPGHDSLLGAGHEGQVVGISFEEKQR